MGLIEQKIQVELNQIGQTTVDALVRSLVDSGDNATGNLKQSIDYKAIAKMPGDDISKLSMEFAILMDPYWYQVNNGRKAGKMPPVNAIMEWVKRKETFKIKKESLDKQGRPRYKSIAFAIAMKIKKKGTKGSKFVDKVITDKWYNMINVRVEELIGEAVEFKVSSVFQKLEKK